MKDAARLLHSNGLVNFSMKLIATFSHSKWSGRNTPGRTVAGSCGRLPSIPSSNSFTFLVLLPLAASYS